MHWFRRLLIALLLVVAPAEANAARAYKDITCETTATTGTGTLNLAGAYQNYLTFVTQVTTGDTVPYNIVSGNGQVETGVGVFTDATPDTLTRASDIVSTAGVGTKLTLTGTSRVCLGFISAWTQPNLGTADSPTFGGVEFGGTSNTLTCSGGTCTVEGNTMYRAGGTDVAVADGGTGASTLTDLITLTTMTTGVYVAQVADGTGVDGSANAEGATYTPSLDLTEITPTVTWGAGSFTTETFDVGATDIAFEFASGTWTVDIGGTNELTLTASAFSPGVNDGSTLGTASLAWADLFFASGGTIEWDGGTSNTMTCTGGNCTIEGNTMYRAGGTDVAVADGGTGASALTDLITLTTHTSGNYVATVADGTGVDGTASGEGTTYTPTLDLTEISSGTWGAGSFTTFTFDAGATDPTITFGSGTILMEGIVSVRQADAANAGGQIKWLEDPGTGSNFIAIAAPASISSDVTCTLENDGNPIPDSCVGDGTDATGAGDDATGKQTKWIPADSMTPGTTAGCVLAWNETGTNDIMFPTCDFSTSTQQGAYFNWALPKQWNESTVTAVFYWSHPATATNFGVEWDIACGSLSNDDALDTALGTAVEVGTDTGGTTDDLYVTSETAAVTCAGTPAEGDLTYFRVRRVPADGGDNLAVAARLHGIKLHWTNNAGTDD